MKKGVTVIFAAIGTLAVLWLATLLLIRWQIAVAIANYESMVSNSAELLVDSLEYEAGFLGGQLHFDIQWQPDPTTQLGLILTQAQQNSGFDFRISGTAEVRHGPFVGGELPFALARIDWEYIAVQELLEALPDHPADQALLSSSSFLTFGGVLESQFTVADIRTTVEDVLTDIQIDLAGLNASISLDPRAETAQILYDFDRFLIESDFVEMAWEDLYVQAEGTATSLQLAWELGRLGLQEKNFGLSLAMQGLSGDIESSRFQSSVWLGETTAALESLSIEAGEFSTTLQDMASVASTSLDEDGRIEGHSETRVPRWEIAGNVLNDLSLLLSMNNINLEAYSFLLQQPSNLEPMTDEQLQDFLEFSNNLLADRPVIGLDELSLSVVDGKDLSLSMSLGYAGDTVLDGFEQAGELADGIEYDAAVSVTPAALRRLLTMGVGAVSPALQGGELDTAVDDLYTELLANLAGSELALISDTTISSSMQLRNNIASVNGTDLGSSNDILQSILAPDAAGSVGTIAGGATRPEFFGEPRLQRVNLASGFLPDPHTVPLRASGEGTVVDLLGVDCNGNVSSAQPDVTLTFEAGGDYGLYLYAESTFDTTLVVLTPQGWFCDDDSHGDFDPGLLIERPLSGDYMIWVGTYHVGEASAQLGISEY